MRVMMLLLLLDSMQGRRGESQADDYVVVAVAKVGHNCNFHHHRHRCIHIAHCYYTEIGMNAVYGAEKLCNYYLNCSLKVLRHIQNPNSYLFSLADNKKQFYNSLPSTFTTAQAVELGVNFDFQERRVKDFLNDTVLFKKIKHGTYERRLMDKKEE